MNQHFQDKLCGKNSKIGGTNLDIINGLRKFVKFQQAGQGNKPFT